MIGVLKEGGVGGGLAERPAQGLLSRCWAAQGAEVVQGVDSYRLLRRSGQKGLVRNSNSKHKPPGVISGNERAAQGIQQEELPITNYYPTNCQSGYSPTNRLSGYSPTNRLSGWSFA